MAVFYWSSKSAISVEIGVGFFVQNPLGCMCTLMMTMCKRERPLLLSQSCNPDRWWTTYCFDIARVCYYIVSRFVNYDGGCNVKITLPVKCILYSCGRWLWWIPWISPTDPATDLAADNDMQCACSRVASVWLTHILLDIMAAISQTTFSKAMIKFDFWLNFHWRLFLRVQFITTPHWFILFGAKPLSEPMLIQFIDAYMRH